MFIVRRDFRSVEEANRVFEIMFTAQSDGSQGDLWFDPYTGRSFFRQDKLGCSN